MKTLYNMAILAKREFFTTLFSPIAFIIAAVFLGVFGFWFYSSVRTFEQATLRFTFSSMSMVLIFIIPIITMRAFAEEKKSGTIESLLTAPITEFQLVAAKFLGCMAFFVFLLAPTSLYIYQLVKFGATPNYPEMLVGYLGMLLLAAVYVSFGLLCSSLVRDQIIAAFVACIVLLGMNLVGIAGQYVTGNWVNVVYFLTIGNHLESFNRGIIDSRGLVYFGCLIITFFVMTVKVVETKKWQ